MSCVYVKGNNYTECTTEFANVSSTIITTRRNSSGSTQYSVPYNFYQVSMFFMGFCLFLSCLVLIVYYILV